MNLKEFIEVTSIYDGKKASIRAACIDSIVDNAPEIKHYADGCRCVVKPACRTIKYNYEEFDCLESYEDICDMIYNAEL